jgi:hypothetical protein
MRCLKTDKEQEFPSTSFCSTNDAVSVADFAAVLLPSKEPLECVDRNADIAALPHSSSSNLNDGYIQPRPLRDRQDTDKK